MIMCSGLHRNDNERDSYNTTHAEMEFLTVLGCTFSTSPTNTLGES